MTYPFFFKLFFKHLFILQELILLLHLFGFFNRFLSLLRLLLLQL